MVNNGNNRTKYKTTVPITNKNIVVHRNELLENKKSDQNSVYDSRYISNDGEDFGFLNTTITTDDYDDYDGNEFLDSGIQKVRINDIEFFSLLLSFFFVQQN